MASRGAGSVTTRVGDGRICASIRTRMPAQGIRQRALVQSGLYTRCLEAGAFTSLSAARDGRIVRVPPQLGQRRPGNLSAQSVHQVHSKEQIQTSSADGKRSRSQHSQFGRISSTPHDQLQLSSLQGARACRGLTVPLSYADSQASRADRFAARSIARRRRRAHAKESMRCGRTPSQEPATAPDPIARRRAALIQAHPVRRDGAEHHVLTAGVPPPQGSTPRHASGPAPARRGTRARRSRCRQWYARRTAASPGH